MAGKRVNSVLRAINVLELLNQHGDLTFTQLLNESSIAKSTLFDILATLESADLIRKVPETHSYQLGIKLVEFGGTARSNIEIRSVARPIMIRLNAELNLTVHLVVLAHGEILPIETCESEQWYRHHFRFSTAIGVPAPMYCTGAGKAILANLPESQIAGYVQSTELVRYTDTTITDTAHLQGELETVAARGYAVGNAEHDELIRSVAAPVWSHEGRVIASLSALGLVTRFPEGRIGEVADAITDASAELSRQMGHQSRR